MQLLDVRAAPEVVQVPLMTQLLKEKIHAVDPPHAAGKVSMNADCAVTRVSQACEQVRSPCRIIPFRHERLPPRNVRGVGVSIVMPDTQRVTDARPGVLGYVNEDRFLGEVVRLSTPLPVHLELLAAHALFFSLGVYLFPR